MCIRDRGIAVAQSAQPGIRAWGQPSLLASTLHGRAQTPQCATWNGLTDTTFSRLMEDLWTVRSR
eukprot:13996992-Alexandrium_andersonii.AAC.1